MGLYSPDELVYENIKDREGKMKFLQKMIDVVSKSSPLKINLKFNLTEHFISIV